MARFNAGQHGSHKFSEIPRAEIPRSQLDRSHGHKTTFDAGYLVPIFVEEALPGDTLNLRGTGFGRIQTLIQPIMDNVYMDFFFFSVPYRLVWDNWQRFNGEQTDPGDSTDYLIPQLVSPVGGYGELSLEDYFGLPVGVAGITHSALWHRAYNLIFNEWFRDQNLVDSLPVPRDDGPDDPADYVLKRRGKRHDYFSSCLPWPQKGPSVELPLGSLAPLVGTGLIQEQSATDGIPTFDYANISGGSLQVLANAVNAPVVQSGTTIAGGNRNMSWNNPKLEVNKATLNADLSSATAATINELRQAFQIQRLYERDARGGTRYTEIILSHFGVTSPDARLQRPEFLGGGSLPLLLTPVPQTAVAASDVTPIGTLKAYGVVQGSGFGFKKSFTEHCLVIGMVVSRVDLNYQQGLNRMWSRQTRFEHFWPALAHLGEQAVLSKEIYCDGTAADDDVFGYQERYAEYRYKPSMITGRLRSQSAVPLDTWHLAQEFATRPVLGEEFIEEDPPIDRVISVTNEPHFIMDFHFRYMCARPMPTYSVPGLIDHF